MKIYSASATCDWGIIFSDERIKAGKWSTAFNRAGHMAQTRARRRPKQIAVSLVLVGTIKKPPKDNSSYLGLPADETTEEAPC